MTKIAVDPSLPVDKLVAAYVAAAIANGSAIDAGDYRTANRQHDIGVSLARELVKRGPSAQRLLIDLLEAENPWVRFWAAGEVLKFAPAKAERVLAQLAASPPSLVRLSAETLLSEWSRGTLAES